MFGKTWGGAGLGSVLVFIFVYDFVWKACSYVLGVTADT
tara:strand:+ start:105 stop:221 length:117 start_codon:yes stop_codon:yes gene_type:complete